MANGYSEIQTITFDVSDPEITHVKITVKLTGDCPVQMKTVYEKSFPARISAVTLMMEEVPNYLLW